MFLFFHFSLQKLEKFKFANFMIPHFPKSTLPPAMLKRYHGFTHVLFIPLNPQHILYTATRKYIDQPYPHLLVFKYMRISQGLVDIQVEPPCCLNRAALPGQLY